MTGNQRGILIKTIINRLGELNQSENKKLVKHNLYSEQKEFNETDLFFKLCFKTDNELNNIFDLVIN